MCKDIAGCKEVINFDRILGECVDGGAVMFKNVTLEAHSHPTVNTDRDPFVRSRRSFRPSVGPSPLSLWCGVLRMKLSNTTGDGGGSIESEVQPFAKIERCIWYVYTFSIYHFILIVYYIRTWSFSFYCSPVYVLRNIHNNAETGQRCEE